MDLSERHLEMLELLAGARGAKPATKLRAAVRIEDLRSLLQLSGKLQSAKVSSAPTADEFNALVEDVHRIHARLTATIETIAARLR